MVCLMFSIITFAQNSSNKGTTPPKFKAIKNAIPENTDNALLVNNYLKENLVCPKGVAECGMEGTEIVQFTVTESGNVQDFKVINSICPEIDREVIRVLKTTSGMWSPGIENGKPVATTNEATFMLGNYNESTISEHFTRVAARYFKGGNKNFFEKNNPEKAIRYYNRALNYLPNDEVLLSTRGLCHYQLGNIESAKEDWKRVVTLGGTYSLEINYDVAGLEGYSEMKEIMAQNEEN